MFELVVIGMSCVAPWAYGSVDAWAEMLLFGGATLLAALRSLADWQVPASAIPVRGARLLVLGLIALAVFQVAPLGTGLLSTVSPSTNSLRSTLTPRSPEQVTGDSGATVALPRSTISVDPDATLHVVAQLTAVLIVFDCVARSSGGLVAFRRLSLALSWNCGLLSLFSLGQTLTWNGKIYGLRAHYTNNGWMTGGPFFCHNHLAAYLNLGLGLTLGLLVGELNSSRKRGPRRHSFLLRAYVAGLIVLGVLGSSSRGGFLSMSAALVASAILLKKAQSRVPLWGLGMVVGFIFVFTLAIGRDAPFQRVATIPDVATSGFNGRSEIWQGAFSTWRANPVFGSGFGAYAVASAPNYELQKYGSQKRFFTHAESEYLELLAESGIVGLALAVALLGLIGRRAWQAFRAASGEDRPLVLGGLFGIVAVAIQCLADFPLHVAGVMVPAVVISASLYRLGSAAERRTGPAENNTPQSRWPSITSWNVALVLGGFFVIAHERPLVIVERSLVEVGLPLPGTTWLSIDTGDHPRADLERMRAALDRIVRERPNWAEGHLQHGLVLLALYRYAAADALAVAGTENPSNVPAEAPSPTQTEKPESSKNVLTDPLWLHGIVHHSTSEDLAQLGAPVEHEPVVTYLVPATRSFLEARRCSPLLPVPHARLASLDFLLKGADTSVLYARRAFKLGGRERGISAFCAQIALNLDEPEFAAKCWQNYLLTRDSDWEWVADSAASILNPDQLLQMLEPVGAKHILLFADRLYGSFFSTSTRLKFLNAALERIPSDATLGQAERLWYEGKARAGLGQHDVAKKRMSEALNIDPQQKAWRLEYMEVLVRWGDQQEAYRQASVGARLYPKDGRFERVMKQSLDALLRQGIRPSRIASSGA
jgi:O-antigen ligase/tetratricopeptide (TPR) repeat protein